MGVSSFGARVRRIVPPVLFTVAFIVMLELLRRASGASNEVFPPVADVIESLVELPGRGEFWTMIRETLSAWLVSLVLALIIGLPLGFAMGSNYYVRSFLTVPVEFLRPIPSVAMIPLAVVLWGAGLESKMFLATFAATWPLLYQARYGAGAIDAVLRQTSRVYGLSKLGIVRYVIAPSMAPFVATGIRLASSIALILTLTAELLIGGGGLGGGIEFARLGANLPEFYALIIVTGLLGWIMSSGLAWIERRRLFWHASHREVIA